MRCNLDDKAATVALFLQNMLSGDQIESGARENKSQLALIESST